MKTKIEQLQLDSRANEESSKINPKSPKKMEEKSETEEQRLARSAFEAQLRIQKKKTLKLEEEKAKKEIPTKDVNSKVSQSFIEDDKVENSI